MRVVDIDRVLAQLRGAIVESAEETTNGMHLRLLDGRIVVSMASSSSPLRLLSNARCNEGPG